MHTDDNGVGNHPSHRRRRQAVTRQVKCECGYVARAQTDQDVVSDIRDHIRTDHPELVDEISDEQIIDWIEVVD
jgi:predicted small metal-binding protein